MTNQNIGISELIEQVEAELLAKAKITALFVESVELELQVTVKKEGKAGIKIDVISFGGAEVGGGLGQDNIQKIKIKLSPLLDKEEIKKTLAQEELSGIRESCKKKIFRGNNSGVLEGPHGSGGGTED
jgi:hypothetical protein